MLTLREATATDLYRFQLIDRTPIDVLEPWVDEVESFFIRDAGFWLRGDSPGTHRHLLIIEDAGNEMIGAAAWELAEGAAYVAAVLLEHHHRGGRGRRFLDMVLDEIAAAAPDAVAWWWVDHRNVAMIELSERIVGGPGHREDQSRYVRFEVLP